MKIKENLGYFEKLNELNVKNFFTYGNDFWGSMRVSANKGSVVKYSLVFRNANIDAKEFLYMKSEHNNDIQIIDEKNLKVYKIFNEKLLFDDSEDFKGYKIHTDGFITKEQIPLLVAPADCAVIAITGVDKKDNKRFVILLHSGLSGTILDIVGKSLELAHLYYEFSNSELSAFVYPHISGKHYRKKVEGNNYMEIFKSDDWKIHIDWGEVEIGIDFGSKLQADLTRLGIGFVEGSGLETFEENEKKNLYSTIYNLGNDEEYKKRFLIGVSL